MGLLDVITAAQGLGSGLKLVVAITLAVVWLGSYVGIVGLLYRQPATEQQTGAPQVRSDPLPPSGGQGGQGGSAKVLGSGVAIGGPGGQAGRSGRGGDGGSAEIHGDGHAAGGEGGSVNDEGVWRHPAKSGYEVHQRALGLPVDPNMKPYGRGGAPPGYEPKLHIVEQLRADYFREHRKAPQSVFENINAVPLDYLNISLSARKETWRVRIVDDDEYEFYIP